MKRQVSTGFIASEIWEYNWATSVIAAQKHSFYIVDSPRCHARTFCFDSTGRSATPESAIASHDGTLMAQKMCSILFFGPGGAVDEKNCKVNPVTFVKNHISSLSPFILSSKYQFQNFSVITFSGSSVFVMAFSGFSEEIKT